MPKNLSSEPPPVQEGRFSRVLVSRHLSHTYINAVCLALRIPNAVKIPFFILMLFCLANGNIIMYKLPGKKCEKSKKV